VLDGETGLSVLERGRAHQEFGPLHSDRQGGGQLSHVSCCTFFLAEIAVELAEQGVAVFLGPVGQVNDKILDLLARCLAQGLDSAEIGCVRLD